MLKGFELNVDWMFRGKILVNIFYGCIFIVSFYILVIFEEYILGNLYCNSIWKLCDLRWGWEGNK